MASASAVEGRTCDRASSGAHCSGSATGTRIGSFRFAGMARALLRCIPPPAPEPAMRTVLLLALALATSAALAQESPSSDPGPVSTDRADKAGTSVGDRPPF